MEKDHSLPSYVNEINGKVDNILGKIPNLQEKEDDTLNTVSNNIVGAINELKDEIENGNGNIDLTDYVQKTELTSELAKKVDDTTYQADKQQFQPKTDTLLETDDKTVTGAINELKEKIANASNVDLSNYYNKGETDTELNKKQDKEDNSLNTTSKNIVGAINELKVSVDSGASVDLSNYYNKQETYNKTEIDDKVDLKADKTVVDSINTQLVNKADTTDIPTNISQLNNDSGYINEIVGGNGVEVVDNNVSVKVDGSTITFDDSGNLKSLAQGGSSGSVLPNVKAVEVVEEQIASYDSSKSSAFSSTNNLECKNSGYAGGVGAFAIDLSKLRGKGCVLEISSYMSNIQKINDYTWVRPQMEIYLTVGDVYNGSQVARTISLGSCWTGYKSPSGGATYTSDYTNNNKKYYVAIPEIYSNPNLKAYVCIVNSQNSRYGSASISCKVVANTDVNTVFATENFETHYMVKTGQGNGDFFITNKFPLIKYPSNVYNNLSIGANNLTKMGTEDGKYTYYNVIYGNNLLKENCTELQYATIIGSNIDDTGTGSYPNYNYLQKAEYPTYIGYGITPTDQSYNEIVIGSYAKGHGSNTVTLGGASVIGLYCQATAITQSCDPRLKENIEDVDVDTVIDALMQIKVIRASYRNLEEFRGSNENDKNKLMWDADNMSKIPLFAKDVKMYDKYVTPLNDDGTVMTQTVQEVQRVPVATTFGVDDNEPVYEERVVDVEVPKEKELIENCKEFTPNQITQALVVGFQEQQRQIELLQSKITELENKLNNKESN